MRLLNKDSTDAGTFSHDKARLAVLWGTLNHLSCKFCSTDVRAGRWLRIWETNPSLWKQVCVAHIQWTKRIRRTWELLLSTVKRRKLFDHVCPHDTLPKIMLHETVNGSRRRTRLRKSWMDNIKKSTGQSLSSLLRIAGDRSRWATIAAKASVGVPSDAWASRM